jgi:hypothetical protein
MRWRWFMHAGAAVVLFGALAYSRARVQALCVREGYRLSELGGIMAPGGALGGQVSSVWERGAGARNSK